MFLVLQNVLFGQKADLICSFFVCNGIPSENQYFSVLGQYYKIVKNFTNMGHVLAVPQQAKNYF